MENEKETVENEMIFNDVHLGKAKAEVLNISDGHCRVVLSSWIPGHIIIFDYEGITNLKGENKSLPIIAMMTPSQRIRPYYLVRYFLTETPDIPVTFNCSELTVREMPEWEDFYA